MEIQNYSAEQRDEESGRKAAEIILSCMDKWKNNKRWDEGRKKSLEENGDFHVNPDNKLLIDLLIYDGKKLTISSAIDLDGEMEDMIAALKKAIKIRQKLIILGYRQGDHDWRDGDWQDYEKYISLEELEAELRKLVAHF